MHVIVQTDKRASLLIGTISLNHLASNRKPLAAIGLNKQAALIAMNCWFNDKDPVNFVARRYLGHCLLRINLAMIADHQA